MNYRKLYWLNVQNNKVTLEQSSLTGKNQQTILSEQLFRPRSLIIKGGFIYWVDGISKSRRGFKVERFNMDTKKRETVCHHKNLTILPFAMDVSDSLDSIYMSDWHNMAVWKLNLPTIEKER